MKKPSTHSISISNRFSKCKVTKFERRGKKSVNVKFRAVILCSECVKFFCAFIVAVENFLCARLFSHCPILSCANFFYQFYWCAGGDRPPYLIVSHSIDHHAYVMCILVDGQVKMVRNIY